MRRVIDSSVLLVALFGEAGVEEAANAVADGVISAINLAEVVAVLRRRGASEQEARLVLAGVADRTIAFDREQAVDSGLLDATTRAAGLSLGDRACLTLAQHLRSEAVTTDRAWVRVAEAVGVEVRLIR